MATCKACGDELPLSYSSRKWCSSKCKSWWRKRHGGKLADGHSCRECGNHIPLEPGQGNRWICSDVCRRSRQARAVREFHVRKPHMERVYRERTRAKQPPDSNLTRFYRWNPGAPKSCQSCGESQVLEVAHRPSHRRLGSHRARANSKWPDAVWVLCPTCHRLLDRMHYPPSELGLA